MLKYLIKTTKTPDDDTGNDLDDDTANGDNNDIVVPIVRI
jgi:hypothetical protein